jgi:hypothetical protein
MTSTNMTTKLARSSGIATRLLGAFLAGLCLSGLSLSGTAGCGNAPGVTSRDPVALAESLRERASEFWQSRVDMLRLYDDEKAYDELLARQFDFWDPEFKKRVRLSEYRSSRGSAIYENFAILGVKVDGDVGYVDVKYTWRMANPPAGMTSEATRTETSLADREWLLVDGVWYKKYDVKRAMGNGSRGPSTPVTEQEDVMSPAPTPSQPAGEGG